ncbi:hypothetical protein JXX18_13225 [Ruthenibacterium lactatiformans]|uniref:zinc finger domain-containing protein n=1 Tax=Ruthenibacterium lactatiformans TaxID=1550024 RepID=UPI001967E0FE|nr:hypothetical protein [Ruthenibacterium lactatiformans]MBN3016766.1 hypothetical protein [Ruthenibacterium lactatiformans]
MATQVTNYQCPSCTGPLHFGSGSGKLECAYCGTLFEVAVIEQMYAGKEQAAAAVGTDPQWDLTMAGDEWNTEEAAHMRAYSCPSCGAQLICDDTTVATSCPYCSNPTVVPGQFSGMLRPDYVIPFRMDKNAAKAALKQHYKGKKFLPKSFSSDNHIEDLKGIYVPFWLFDGASTADIRYRGTINHSHTEGNQKVTVTEHYHVARSGSARFEKVPVDGSTKMPDAHMDAIEPYDYSALVPFSSAYLPGFMADKYDVEADTCCQRANERIRASTRSDIAATVAGYASVTPENEAISINNGAVKYALLPVWMLNTKWKDRDFLFAMNGQTGRLIGDLPVDWRKFFVWFAGISLLLMLLLGIILF